MSAYWQLAKLRVFSVKDVVEILGNRNSAYSLLRRLIRGGYVVKIRSNLYSCVEPQTDRPIATRFHIASAINDSSYVSHHTALEYYGLTNQVHYHVYVSSSAHFRDFEFEGFTYRRVPSRFLEGVVTPEGTKGIRVTDIERTIVDSIKDFERIGGLEELLGSIEMLTYLDSDKLVRYLTLYDLRFLFQKTGFILEHFKDSLKLPEGFFQLCKNSKGKSTRYLFSAMSGERSFKKEWGLVVPGELKDLNSGGDQLA
jgi:predicted transcriptional regulator of viral defense system